MAGTNKAPETEPAAPAKKVRRKLPELDVSAIEVRTATPEEVTQYRRRRGTTRSSAQQQIDTLVDLSHKAWVKAGKPTDWKASAQEAGYVLRAAEGQWETLVAAVRRAGNYHDVRVLFGDIQREDGYVQTVFVASDKLEKAG